MIQEWTNEDLVQPKKEKPGVGVGQNRGTRKKQAYSIRNYLGTSLVVQWLRLWAPIAGGPDSIPDQGARSHMLQLRPRAAKKKKNYLQWSSLVMVESELLL